MKAVAILPLAALLALAGCTTPDTAPRRSVHGAILLPPDVTNIGLTVTRPGSGFTLELPATKASAARSEAALGARSTLADPQVALLFPVGYALGGILGGVLGVGEEELKTATEAIHAAVPELLVDERIAHAITGHINTARPGQVHAIDDNIPTDPPAVHGLLRRATGTRLTWIKPSPAPHPLAGTSIDTVIGVRVTFQGFQARPNPNFRSNGELLLYNPPLSLVLTVDVSAVRVRDWANLGGLTATYESRPRKFTEWAAGGATPLRRESEAALQEILRQVTAQLSCSRPTLLAYE